MKNIAIITLDALRWDASQMANTPYFNELFAMHNTHWRKVYTQGTYTLPSHISVFQAGILPGDRFSNEPIYNREKCCTFRAQLSFTRGLSSLYPTPPAENVVKGFEKLGYRTVGIGGVGWFNTEFATSSIWKSFFKEFYWMPSFGETNPNALLEQIKLMETLKLKETKPLYFFLNVPTTHEPCRGNNSLLGQAKALEWVDSHFEMIIDMLPKPIHLFMFADHGTCFESQDKVAGHTFYHPSINEIPMVHLDIK